MLVNMADARIFNPTPKQQFLESKESVAAHNRLLENSQLLKSISTAMLEQQRIVTGSVVEGNSAAATAYMLKGAQHFVDIFLKLTAATERPEQPKVVSLDHRA
jgi:hypothetical protein